MKNQIRTAGYLIKRLRDAGFVSWKMFNQYSNMDTRQWTILVDPGGASVYITCFKDKEMIDGICFQLYDGGKLFSNNMLLKTQSAEVIIKALLDAGISNNPTHNPFYSNVQ